jgi:hypothetical protein
MTLPRARLGLTLVGILALLPLSACASAREQREVMAKTSETWSTELMPGEQEEVIEAVRALGAQDPDDADSLLSIQALLRQARPRGNLSMLVRAEALRAAWSLGSHLTAEPLRADTLTPQEFSERTRLFEQLTVDPTTPPDDPRLLELARFLGTYRFAPGEEDLALDLADLVVSRALFAQQSPVQSSFLETAPGSVRHALVLMTLRLADDAHGPVRNEALAGARYMHPGPGMDLLAGALGIERDRRVLLTALDSLEALVGQVPAEDLERVLDVLPVDSDLTIRRRVAEVREGIGA